LHGSAGEKPSKNLKRAITDKVMGFKSHQVKGFVPTTKVIVRQPNPRFSYESNLLPVTASLNLNSAKSEANFNGPLKARKELSRVKTHDTLEKGSGMSDATQKMSKLLNFNTARSQSKKEMPLRMHVTEQAAK
jgi:hypothetical protein